MTAEAKPSRSDEDVERVCREIDEVLATSKRLVEETRTLIESMHKDADTHTALYKLLRELASTHTKLFEALRRTNENVKREGGRL